MRMTAIPFEVIDWSMVPPTEHQGERGKASLRAYQLGPIRMRMVAYTRGYLAANWCSKRHLVLCLEGELHTELADGRCVTLTPGMSYHVADGGQAHRSHSPIGAKLFVVD